MSSGVTMRNSKARNFLYGLVICAMCLTVYLLSRTHSQLKIVEKSQDKCVQQRDSLSAQLQVVYEHKSRLEKSLQEEKASHKNFRLEAQQNNNAIQNQMATEKRLAQEKLEFLTNEKQELEEKCDESEKKLNLLMNVIDQSKQNLSHMEEAKMKIQSDMYNQLQIIRQQKDEQIEINRELEKSKEDLTQSNLNQAWKLQKQAEEIDHWKKNYKDLESQLQHASEQLQEIRARIKDDENKDHDHKNVDADAHIGDNDKKAATKLVNRMNEDTQDKKDKEDKVNMEGNQQNYAFKEDYKLFPDNQLGDVAESQKLSFEPDNKERKIEPVENQQGNKLIKYPSPKVLEQKGIAYNSVGDDKVADNSMNVGNQPDYGVGDVLNKENKAGDHVHDRVKHSEGGAAPPPLDFMPRAEQKLDNKPLDLPIHHENQGLVDQSLGLLGNSRNENIHYGIDHFLHQGAGKSGKMNFFLPNKYAEDVRDSKVNSNGNVAVLERPRVAVSEEQHNQVRGGQFEHNPLHYFPQPRPEAEKFNPPLEKSANGQHKNGADRQQMESPHLPPVNDLSHQYMFPLHPVGNNRAGNDYQFNVIPKPLPLKPQNQNLNFNEKDLISNHKPAPQMAGNNAEDNEKLDSNLQEKAGMNRDHLFPPGDLSHRWRAGFGQNAGLVEKPYNNDESQKEKLKIPNMKQNSQGNKDGDHDYDYNGEGDDGDDQDLDGGNEDDQLIADNQNELGHGKVFQDADFDDQLQNNEDDEANQVPAGHDKNQEVGVMVVPR
ncbi:Golgi integral membrane protein 4-like isoform X2 [Limulus polyphemus]|uniref:Golgi integral membrane protein 4-like isoform X2 n=1 Tax=Limulus polyphemus TaxID=6850 RepID=A0ABM1S441_LIMPO|nr:Golgi integral membrane protein 4-like isoform X2 [Limulus polyphemus]